MIDTNLPLVRQIRSHFFSTTATSEQANMVSYSATCINGKKPLGQFGKKAPTHLNFLLESISHIITKIHTFVETLFEVGVLLFERSTMHIPVIPRPKVNKFTDLYTVAPQAVSNCHKSDLLGL